MTFAQAVKSMLFEPLGMTDSHYSDNDAMTRRFSVGHNLAEDGTLSVAQQWNDNRANEPGGGLASTVADQLRWARFHLGDGAGLLPAEVLHRMTEPTVELHGSALGDAMGLCWFLRDIDGVATIGHGGSANGQFAELLLVPERDFAVIVLSNVGPDGGLALNRAVVRWALEHYLGVVDRDPEPLPFDEAAAREVVGNYANDMMSIIFALTPAGLTAECVIKPEVRAAATTEMPPNVPPAAAGLLPGDEYIVLSGGLNGLRGRFLRDDTGAVAEMDMAGRVFRRV
jgi:CubicO group peptidase (beta-lactamase class C family)